ncbi:MAG: hypothetical protein WAM13_21520 [Candidatus Sulfotelmatobacter sp.]
MRHLLLFSALLLAMSWAAAQTPASQGTSGNTGQETVKGCLSSSGGNYMLTEKNGKTFQLTGDTSKLSEHVGHEIKVTGTEGSAPASSNGAMSEANPTLEVSTFKHISKTCEGASASH